MGGAIANALQWRVGDSDDDSELDLTAAPTDPLRHQRSTVGPTGRAPTVPSRARPTATASESRPLTETEPGAAARPSVVTGTGATSDLVINPMARPDHTKRKFVLEGFRPDASDQDAHSLVQSVVDNLHNFHPLPRHDAAAISKSYVIEVDTDDEALVMNPDSWPAGLTVRPKPANRQRRRRPFRASRPAVSDRSLYQAAVPPRHQVPKQNGEWHRAAPVPGEWRGAAPSTAAQQSRQDTALYSDVITGYTQEHGEWQVASNRRRRRQNHFDSSSSAGHNQQTHWSRRPTAQHWQRSDYRRL